MLILTRKKDESLMIGHDIVIKIVEIDEGKVRIGIEAPKHIEIHRKEVYDRIQEENKIAVGTNKKLDELSAAFIKKKDFKE